MSSYEIRMPGRVLFGWGVLEQMADVARELGSSRALLVTGSQTLHDNGTIDQLSKRLTSAGIEVDLVGVQRTEPRVSDIDRLLAAARGFRPDAQTAIIAIGGGSAIDAAKAVAALIPNGGDCLDYLEGVGRGVKLTQPSLPLVAVPTTAGTGSECTKNAVISGDEGEFKKSMRSAWMIPSVALVDPELTVSLPPHVTASTGMDAITQLVESYVSCRANPFTKALCGDAIPRAMAALRVACSEPTNREARTAMSSAAMWSGIALANSGLGIAHGLAAALGVHAGVEHGRACALLLPLAIRLNLQAAMADFAALGRRVNPELAASSDAEAAADFARRIDELCDAVGVPRRLADVNVGLSQLPPIVRDSAGNSRNGNPVPLDDATLLRELEAMA